MPRASGARPSFGSRRRLFFRLLERAFTVAAQAPCSLFPMYRRWQTWKPVVVLCDGFEEATAMGRTLAAIYDLPLVALVLAHG